MSTAGGGARSLSDFFDVVSCEVRLTTTSIRLWMVVVVVVVIGKRWSGGRAPCTRAVVQWSNIYRIVHLGVSQTMGTFDRETSMQR